MQQLKLFRPSAGPAKELCSHFETTITTSPNAQRGIEFHEVIAALLTGEIKIEQVPEAYRKSVSYAIELFPSGNVVEIEFKVELLDRNKEFITSGTIDLWSKDPRLEIIDWKTGQERNYWMQISIYAVGLMDSLFSAPHDDIEIDLTLAFVDQEHHFTRTERYGELRARVDSLVEDIRDPTSPYSLNHYCGYCDLRGRCPAWDRERALLARGNDDLRASLDIIRQDPVALAKFIVALRRLNKLAQDEDLDKLAIEYLKAGKDVPGLNVVRSEGKPVYDKEALAQAIKLWEEDHGGDRFPISRTPYEYLKMTK